VSPNKSAEQLRHELRALEELMFLLSPERRERLKSMLVDIRREVAKAEGGDEEERTAHCMKPLLGGCATTHQQLCTTGMSSR
jgi:hypothetical protein